MEAYNPYTNRMQPFDCAADREIFNQDHAQQPSAWKSMRRDPMDTPIASCPEMTVVDEMIRDKRTKAYIGTVNSLSHKLSVRPSYIRKICQDNGTGRRRKLKEYVPEFIVTGWTKRSVTGE